MNFNGVRRSYTFGVVPNHDGRFTRAIPLDTENVR